MTKRGMKRLPFPSLTSGIVKYLKCEQCYRQGIL